MVLLEAKQMLDNNLDMQYLTTVNPYGPTTYFYVTLADVATDPFLAFAMALADLVEPIYVASISWGSIESEEVPSIMASFDVEAAKLGLKGGTIVVSSGDDGANGLGTECGYAPSFPASSPNVLAVGATNAYAWSGAAGKAILQVTSRSPAPVRPGRARRGSFP